LFFEARFGQRVLWSLVFLATRTEGLDPFSFLVRFTGFEKSLFFSFNDKTAIDFWQQRPPALLTLSAVKTPDCEHFLPLLHSLQERRHSFGS